MSPEEKEFYDGELADLKKAQTLKVIIGVVTALVILGVASLFTPLKSVVSDGISSVQDSDMLLWGCVLFFAIVSVMFFYLDWKKNKKQNSSVSTGCTAKSSKELERVCIFFVFHLLIGFTLWAWAHYFIYPGLGGEGFWKSAMDLVGILLIAKSVWDSFDTDTINLNWRGEILYFNRSFASNVEPGFVCLGLPKWLASTIRTQSFTTLNITVGLVKNGIRELFIVECKRFRAVVDVAFEAEPIDTDKILRLEGGAAKIEHRLVTEVNSAINTELNRMITDQDGKEVPAYPTIDDLKSASLVVQENLFGDSSPTGINARFALLGYKLKSITLKDFENEDRQVISAQQALVAKKLLEQAEFLNILSKIDKVDVMYRAMNGIGTANELTGDKMFTREQALGVVERDEGVIKEIVIKGGGSSILMSDFLKAA
jgi:hypothetical protein